MAVSSYGESLTKRSSKYDSFLKKHLDETTFERIRAYEACIVCSEKESKAFKFVVLSDEVIYLTENPPKAIQAAVPLKDVVRIQLVNDFPDFLQGEERKNTMHIEITYLIENSKKGLFRKKSDKDRAHSPGNGHNENFSSVTGAKYEDSDKSPRSQSETRIRNSSVKDISKTSLLSVSTDRLSPRKSPSISPKSNGSASCDENTLKSLLDQDFSDDDNDNLSLSKSMPSVHLRQMQVNAQGDHTNASNNNNKNGTQPVTAGCHLPGVRPLPRRPNDKTTVSATNNNANNVLRNNGADLKIDLSKLHVSQGGGDIYEMRQRSNSNSSSIGADKFGSMDNLSDTADGEDIREAVIHIYMLKGSSPMLMLMQSSWKNFLIRSTLVLDPQFADRTQISPRRVQSEKITLLFNQLKRELLNSDNSMEDTFNLLNELKTAAEKDVTLKKLFWKSPDLFTFIVMELQKYLPKSKAIFTSEHGRQQRADEFEFVNLLVETLALMFRETEILPSRLNCLKSGKGKLAFDLIVVLTCFPAIPPKYKPPNARASALLGQVQSDQWKCLADAEVAKLVKEFTNVSSVVLYELMLIAKQNNWGDEEGSFFNVNWLVNVLEELRTTEKFVERLVGQAMRFVQPSKHVELCPMDAVLVYQQFSLMEMLMKFSPPIASFIRNNYTEEFKYFIQGPVIMEKFPQHYPIRTKSIELIEDVMSAVRQTKCRLSSKK